MLLSTDSSYGKDSEPIRMECGISERLDCLFADKLLVGDVVERAGLSRILRKILTKRFLCGPRYTNNAVKCCIISQHRATPRSSKSIIVVNPKQFALTGHCLHHLCRIPFGIGNGNIIAS